MILFFDRIWPHWGLYLPIVVSRPNDNWRSWGITRNPAKSPQLKENQDSEKQTYWFFLISHGCWRAGPWNQPEVDRNWWTWSWKGALGGLQGARMKYSFLLYISLCCIFKISPCAIAWHQGFFNSSWIWGRISVWKPLVQGGLWGTAKENPFCVYVTFARIG